MKSSNITFGSVCSGIEAASVAWHPLGWRAAWLAEIEAFPSAVLKHHYPDVPNLGDLTKIAAMVRACLVPAPDVLVGGTPCQAFSIAGLRKSLDDARGQLTLSFVDLANAIDTARHVRGEQPCTVVWENVPGVLSTSDNAFGNFLGALAGEDCALEPPGGKWANAGCVFGPQRAVAWRVFDAQYFGVAQRRRRVFVVASAREGFDPAEVLFEFDGLRRDSSPSREAGQDAAAGTLRSTDGGCDVDHGRAGHLQPVAAPVTRSVERPRGDGLDTLITGTLQANGKAAGSATQQDAEAGMLVPIAFSCKDNGRDATENLSPTLRSMGHSGSHANGGGQMAVAFLHTNKGRPDGRASAHEEMVTVKDHVPTLTTGGAPGAVCITGDITHTLKAEGFDASEDGTGRGQPIVASFAFAQNSRDEVRMLGGDGEIVGALAAQPGMKQTTYVAPGGMAVRRLTPRECERLQAFPDDYTLIPVRGKPAADGPRYKALGNSMCVYNMRWIGSRIDAKLRQLAALEVAAA